MRKSSKSTAVKLVDVALRSGVSQSTVSRVLNNQPGISDATRDVVLSSLRELGYKAEAFDALNPGGDVRLRIDVVICPLSEQKKPLTMSYYETVLDGIRAEFDPDEINLRLNILSSESQEPPFRANVSGVLVVGNPAPELIAQLEARAVAYVILSNNLQESRGDLVTVDKFDACITLCRYLTGRGVRRIGLLVPAIDTIYCEGFSCGMKRFGFEVSPGDVQLVSDTDLGSYVEPLHRMLAAGTLPDALVFSSRDAADLCEKMLLCRQIRVPEDLLLVSFVDYEAAAKPGFVTMRFNSFEAGRLAAERLLRRIAAPDRLAYRIVVPMIPCFEQN